MAERTAFKAHRRLGRWRRAVARRFVGDAALSEPPPGPGNVGRYGGQTWAHQEPICPGRDSQRNGTGAAGRRRDARGLAGGHRVTPNADQPMCRPPLMEKSAPVTKPASSEATHDTMEAISSGVPSRLTGIVATILSSTSWRMALTMSVPM